jgi:hypothetical protein
MESNENIPSGKNDMENEINPITLPLQHMEKEETVSKPNIRTLWERYSKQLTRYSWALLLYQSVMGLLLLTLTVIRTHIYIDHWILATMFILFVSGATYGWIIGKKTGVKISDSGDPVFVMTGQWKRFLPMIGVLFIIRMILMYVDYRGIIDTAPYLRSLPLVIAGMLTTRGFSLFFRYFQLKKDNQQVS